MAFISNGTTILDAGAFNVNLGSLVLISEQTASSSANISFTSGIDSTYPIYKFEFINVHPQNDAVNFQFNLSTDGGSNYNVTKTTTSVYAFQEEASGSTGLGYHTPTDLAQSTAFQQLNNAGGIGNDNDQSLSGTLQIFNPSSATFVKHFIACTNQYQNANNTIEAFIAGYGNTTNSVDAVRFQMSSGNIDSGTIKLYGIKDS